MEKPNLYETIAGGKWEKLQPTTSTELDPYLPLLATTYFDSEVICPLLLQYEETNTLFEYIQVIQSLEDLSSPSTADSSINANDLVEAFETATTEDRIKMVILELQRIKRKWADKESHLNKEELDIELFNRDIYLDQVRTIITLLFLHRPASFSLMDTVQSCLHLPFGADIALGIIHNDPSSFTPFFKEIVRLIAESEAIKDTNGSLVLKGKRLLLALSELSPMHATLARAYLLELKQLPDVVLQLTMDKLKDEVMFICSMMGSTKSNTNGTDTDTNSWFWRFVRYALTAEHTSEEVADVINMLRLVLVKRVDGIATELMADRHSSLPKLIALLRCYGALIGLAGFVPKESEFAKLIQVITAAADAGESTSRAAGRRLILVSFCIVVLLCCSRGDIFGRGGAGNCVKSIVDCVKALYANASATPFLILVSLQVHFKQFKEAVAVVQRTLNTPVQLTLDRVAKFGEVVMIPFLNEQVVTKDLISEPSIANLTAISATEVDEMLMRSIYVLLCGRNFQRMKIDPSTWVLSQIRDATLPVHPLIVSITMEYAESCCVTHERQGEITVVGNPNAVVVQSISLSTIKRTMAKLPDAQNVNLMRGTTREKQEFTEAALMLLYLLHYNQRMRMYPNAVANVALQKYPVETFPVRYILQQCYNLSGVRGHCEFIYPPLMKLAMEECPQILWDISFEPKVKPESPRLVFMLPSETHVTSVFKAYTQEQPLETLLVLQQIDEIVEPHDPRIVSYFLIICETLLPQILDEVDQTFHGSRVPEFIERIWRKARDVHARPYELHLLVINRLMGTSKATRSPSNGGNLHYYNLIAEPYCIFECSKGVFSCPPLFRIVLDGLDCFLQMIAVSSAHDVQIENTLAPANVRAEGGSNPNIQEIEQKHLTCLCIVSQCLLELALLSREQPSTQVEIQHSIWEMLQQIFDSTQYTILAVHEQQYNMKLLPSIIQYVPKMQALLEHLPLFFEKADQVTSHEPEKFIFIIHLTSQLCVKYAEVEQSKTLVQLLVKFYNTQLTHLTNKCRSHVRQEGFNWLVKTIDWFPALCRTFPEVRKDLMIILMDLKEVESDIQAIQVPLLEIFEACTESIAIELT